MLCYLVVWSQAAPSSSEEKKQHTATPEQPNALHSDEAGDGSGDSEQPSEEIDNSTENYDSDGHLTIDYLDEYIKLNLDDPLGFLSTGIKDVGRTVASRNRRQANADISASSHDFHQYHSDSYQPYQQPHKTVTKTLNPALSLGSRATSSDTYSPSQQRLNPITPVQNPAYESSQSSKSSQTTDLAKALYLMGFLNNIKNAKVIALPKETGLTNLGSSSGSGPHGETEYGFGAGISSESGTFHTSDNGKGTLQLGGGGNSMITSGNILTAEISHLLRPVMNFLAVQKTSPINHWGTFVQQLGSEKSSSAYKTLIDQINFENRRQQLLLLQLKRLKEELRLRNECSKR